MGLFGDRFRGRGRCCKRATMSRAPARRRDLNHVEGKKVGLRSFFPSRDSLPDLAFTVLDWSTMAVHRHPVHATHVPSMLPWWYLARFPPRYRCWSTRSRVLPSHCRAMLPLDLHTIVSLQPEAPCMLRKFQDQSRMCTRACS